MALPMGDFVRTQVGGRMGGENWVVGLWLKQSGMDGVPTLEQMDRYAQEQYDAFIADFWNPGAGTPWCTRNATGVDVRNAQATFYRDGVALGSGNYTGAVVAGTQTVAHPFYTAICTTTRTATAGRSGRGRIYFPYTGVSVDAGTGQVTSTVVDNLVDLAKTWLEGRFTDSTELPGDPSSTPVVVSSTHGLSSTVTSISIDSRPDTQHGRVNRVSPAYTASDTVSP